MATLVLSTIGRAVGGPLGGLAGTFLGAALDRSVFAGGKTRDGPRLSDLAVQSAAYGEALPRLYGRMRVAGNVIWTSGIRESLQRSGGGKHGPATNNYSYSASFAVVVSARPVTGIERIWADGKLLRAADGGLVYPAVIRTYTGGEDQPADPLIAAAEGIDQAPAYRGLAYVVFDDLPLADYGNRIPNLTFEVVADAGPSIGLATIAADLCAVAAVAVAAQGASLQVQGFAAGSSGSARQSLAQLADLADLMFVDDDTVLHLSEVSQSAAVDLPLADLGATPSATTVPARVDTRAEAGAVPDVLTIGFYDPARDFQLGLQRAVRRTPVIRAEQRDLGVALDALAAKRLAETLLRRAVALRTTGKFSLPWRHAGLRAGDLVRVAGDAESWRVRGWTLVGPVVELDVERMGASTASGDAVADPGRPYDAGDQPNGPTVLHVLDLPPLAGPLPASPRLWLAAAGASAGWRRAEILVSADGGDSYATAATIEGPAMMGIATTALPPGNCDRWDRLSTLEVVLLADAMWLESRSEAGVLAGANLALVGDEIIQFATATPLGAGRFRLSTLLRGRRGTESEALGHVAGERFVLLDTERLAAIDPAAETVGGRLLFKALGTGDDLAAVSAVDISLSGRALQPLSPVAVHVTRANGGLAIGWTRRSRAGFAWVDGVDAPLAEDREVYRLTLAFDGQVARVITVAEPFWDYPAAIFISDGGGTSAHLNITVMQVGASGLGVATTRIVDLAAV